MIPHIMISTHSVCETHDTTVWASSRQGWIGKISIRVLKPESSTSRHVEEGRYV